jgi:gliding motility-associated-like protein
MKTFCLVFILFCCYALKTSAQAGNCPPPNIGFEQGNFTGWSCDTGQIDLSATIRLTPSVPIADRQTLYSSRSSAKRDTFGNFPTLCPYGGKYSIRLGNQSAGRGAERISYAFTVPAGSTQYNMVFYYAVVLQDPPHNPLSQPRFTVKTYDITADHYIDCASFDFIASDSLPGFKLSPLSMGFDSDRYPKVYYKDWAPATINLVNVAGHQMRLEFTTNDCALGQHFGYAYLDVDETCGTPITGNSYCANQSFVNITAPGGGFGGYAWFNADFSKKLSDQQVLTISPPPPDGTKYGVVLYPLFGLGCVDTLLTVVNKIDADLVFKVTDTIYRCAGTGADLTAPSVTAGSSPNLTLSYWRDSSGLNYLYQPENITADGTYYIKAVSTEGCTNISPVTVIQIDAELSVTEPAAVYYPATVDISLTFNHNQTYTYKYFADSLLTIPVADYQHIVHSGTYYIQAVSPGGCTNVEPVTVTVNAPPPPIIKAVNTFTPNNDGINDYFSLTILGFGEFGSLRIYNRYGALVFETKSPEKKWDGTYLGKPLPAGTYYWIFNGKDTFYNTKIVDSGYITLIR